MSYAGFAAILLTVSVLAGAPSPAAAQSAENVAVVINEASPVSQRIGEYYVRKRGIPAANVIRVRTSTSENIDRPAYINTIEGPIAAAIRRQSLQDRILYIVLTKGVPLRVDGTAGPEGTVSSVDSELTVLYSRMIGRREPIRGRVPNPYYLGTSPIREARPFTHRTQGIFLVTRLDAFAVDDVLGLIDRAQSPLSEGLVVLDQRAGLNDNTGDQWLAEAGSRLHDQGHGSRVALDTLMAPAPPAEGVLGYYSWGFFDARSGGRRSGMRFVPGALAGTFVSRGARTFERPPDDWVPSSDERDSKALVFGGSSQSLIGDLIREGVTGVAGHVAEPYLQSTVRPQILFPAYLAGFNLAEAFYLAMPHLSWQTVVIGDPLCRPFTRALLTRTDIEDPIDPKTELPAIFSKRRLEAERLLLKDVPETALTLLLAAEARRARGDIAAARAALEQAIELAPAAVAAQLQLAQILEQSGDHSSAAEQYRAVLKMQPNNIVALNNLAYALAVHLNQRTEAHGLAKRAASLAPTNAMVLDTLGWIEHLIGNSASAAELLSAASRHLPDQPEIRLHAAIAYAAAGELKAAERELKEALRLDPSIAKNEEVRELQRRLAVSRN